MKQLYKYWPTLFAIANLFAVYRLLEEYSESFFLITLAIGVVLIVSRFYNIFSIKTIAKYKFIYIYIMVLWVYQFAFGFNHIHPKTWTYLFAKTVMLLCVVASIERSFEFQKKRFYLIIHIITCILLLMDFFINPWAFDGRMSFGFSNPNQIGSLCAILCSYILQLDKTSINTNKKIILLAITLFGVLMSGSRASLGIVVVAILFKYRLSFKLIFTIVVICLTLFVVLPQYNISFLGIDRLIETVESQNLSQGREMQRKAAWIMIDDSPIEGNGIYCEQSEVANRLSELGAHNTFLDFLKWFGYPLGIILIASLLLNSFWFVIKYWNSSDCIVRGHLIVVLGVLPLSLYEGLIWGVNEINNTLFFISFAVLCNNKLLDTKQTTNQYCVNYE